MLLSGCMILPSEWLHTFQAGFHRHPQDPDPVVSLGFSLTWCVDVPGFLLGCCAAILSGISLCSQFSKQHGCC